MKIQEKALHNTPEILILVDADFSNRGYITYIYVYEASLYKYSVHMDIQYI